MAIASWMIRSRSVRSGRSNRSRVDSEDENVQLDLSKDPRENTEEILRNVCQRNGVAEGRRLGYLNAFVKLVSSNNIACAGLGFSKEELLCCLRPALVHEATQVRAAGLRAMRYLITDESDVNLLVRLQVPSLIARSLDLALRNDMERIQAMRMMRRILAVNASEFPPALVRCLVSLASGGAEVSDRMLRASLALLAEICVLNPPLLVKCGGVSAIVSNILDCGLSRIAEALVGCLLFLLDRPSTRSLTRLELHSLAEPYCDFYLRTPATGRSDRSKDEREVRLSSSHFALLSVLRSWPGVLHFCNPQNICGLRAIVNTLYLKQLDIRKAILDLLYELLGIPQPAWTDEVSVALAAVDPSHPQESWKLNDSFIAAEARSIFPHLSSHRPNIVVQHLAVLLYSFLEAGLLGALVEVIVDEDTFLSVRSTILLGQLLHLVHTLLPPECCDLTPALPTLMWYTVGASRLPSPPHLSSTVPPTVGTVPAANYFVNPASNNSDISPIFPVPSRLVINVTRSNQQQAIAAVAALTQLHSLLSRRPVPASLFLGQVLASVGRPHVKQRPSCKRETRSSESTGSRVRRLSEGALTLAGRRVSRTKLQQLAARESEDIFRSSAVLVNKDGHSWDWDIVRYILQTRSEALRRFDDSNHRTFIKRLVHFFKPSSNRYSRVEIGSNRKAANARTLAAFELLDVLLIADEPEGPRLLSELLADIGSQLDALLTAKSAHDCLLSPQHVNNSLCQDYFLLIGHLTDSSRGQTELDSTGLLDKLQQLVLKTNHDCYVKLVISSLNYSKCSSARRILEQVLKTGYESSRLYATEYMVVQLRAKTQDFASWGLRPLLGQLEDSSHAVRSAALSLLNEACDNSMLLEALVAMRPRLENFGDRALLLQVKLLSSPAGLSHAQSEGFVNKQLEFWGKEFNYRYVRILEGELHDALSLHRRGQDGHYNRRLSSIRHRVRDVFVPTHLYGALAQLSTGHQLLLKDEYVRAILQTVIAEQCSSEEDILNLKAALWAAGHIGSGAAGAAWLGRDGVLRAMVNTAQSCPVYSVRATALYALSLVSTTLIGADLLLEYGWLSVRHNRHEQWPIICNQPSISERCDGQRDGDTASVSSRDLATRVEETETDSSVVTEEYDSSLWDDSASRNGVQFWNESPLLEGCVQRKSRTLPSSRGPPEWSRKQQRSLSESQSGSPVPQTASPAPRVPAPPLVEDKLRCDSGTDSSTSGVSSCDSAVGRLGIGERVAPLQTLSPIPSSTSLNTLRSTTPLATRNWTRSSESSGQWPHLSPPTSGRLTQQDVAGVAALRSLRRQQQQRAGAPASGTLDFFSLPSNQFERPSSTSVLSGVQIKVRSLERQSSFPMFSLPDEFFGATSSNSPARSVTPAHPSDQLYMGICLPKDLSLLFPKPSPVKPTEYEDTRRKMSVSFSEMDSVQETGEDTEIGGLSGSSSEQDEDERCAKGTKSSQSFVNRLRKHMNERIHSHQPSTCLVCSRQSSSHRERKISVEFHHTRLLSETERSHVSTDIDSPLRPRTLSGGSNTSVDTTGSMQDSTTGCGVAKNQVMLRCEVMRHVEHGMSNPMYVKICEQNLLHLKQRCGEMFDDACLYSDISESLASATYRLPARRFLQELFLDVPFSEIYEEALTVLKAQALSEEPRTVAVEIPSNPGSTRLPDAPELASSVTRGVMPALSMVLEESAATEEHCREGGSDVTSPLKMPNPEMRKPYAPSVEPHLNESRSSESKSIETKVNDVNDKTDSVPDRANVNEISETSVGKNVESASESTPVRRPADFGLKNCVNSEEVGKLLPTEKHPPKTVFSLLSQMDGVAINAKRQTSIEQDDAKSPIRTTAMSCRLQSNDGQVEALSGAESPVRARKVATVRQPSMAGLQPTPDPDS